MNPDHHHSPQGGLFWWKVLEVLTQVKGLQVAPAELEDVLRGLDGVLDVAVSIIIVIILIMLFVCLMGSQMLPPSPSSRLSQGDWDSRRAKWSSAKSLYCQGGELDWEGGHVRWWENVANHGNDGNDENEKMMAIMAFMVMWWRQVPRAYIVREGTEKQVGVMWMIRVIMIIVLIWLSW